MTTATMQIAAEHQRQRIPAWFLLDYDEVTNEELAYWAANAGSGKLRAFCGWELEYREAFGIEVYFDEGEYVYATNAAGKKFVIKTVRQAGIRRSQVVADVRRKGL